MGKNSLGRDKMVGVWGRDCNIVERSAWRVRPQGPRVGAVFNYRGSGATKSIIFSDAYSS